jgi:MOSC domain-containing protein YiiM
VDLDALIGKEFRIGRVRCMGVRRADPCAYLEGLLGKPVLAALVGKAGLRADILEDGEIAVGDELVIV